MRIESLAPPIKARPLAQSQRVKAALRRAGS